MPSPKKIVVNRLFWLPRSRRLLPFRCLFRLLFAPFFDVGEKDAVEVAPS